MTRSKRMQPVAQVAESRQRDAARILGERQRVLDEQVRRLEQLHEYRGDYARRFEDGAEWIGLNVREYRVFLSRLNQAIEEQALRVDRARAELERSRGQWTRCRVHRDAVGKAMDRFQEEERQQEARREQAENDELGQRGRRRDP